MARWHEHYHALLRNLRAASLARRSPAMMIQWRWRINASLLRGARHAVVTTLASLLLASVAGAQSAVSTQPELPTQLADSGQLRGGWYPWDPYQYRDYRRGVPILTGFDVEIALWTLDLHAIASNRFIVRAQKEMDLVTGPGQFGAIITSYRSTTNNGNAHT